MDITIAGSPVVVALDDEEFGRINIELAAFDGEVGIGQFPIPDPSVAGAAADGRQLMVEEGSALLTDGFIIDQDWQRGPFRVGDEREYNYSIQDANALLAGFRVIRSRPTETDYARVMAFAALDGPTWDTTWVLNASTVTMSAKKYDGDQGWGELVTDVIEFAGKTLFLHDKAAGGRCLHYHLLTNGHTCGLSITDVLADVDSVTSFAPIAPVRQRTSVDLENDILGRDQANRTHSSTDGTSITAHDADGLQHQALIEFDAASQADLNVKTAAYLASQKNDRDTYTCAIGPLNAAALALIRNGDLISVTSGAMGLTASTQRIAHMALSVWDGVPGLWLATLELGAPVRRRARVSTGAKPVTQNQLLRTVSPWADACTPLRETFTRTVGAGSWGISELGGTVWFPYYNGAAASVNGTDGVLAPTGSIGSSAIEEIGLPVAFPIHLRTKQKILAPDDGILQFYFGPALPYAGAPGNVLISLQETVGGSPNALAMAAEIVGSGGVAAIGSTTYPFGLVDPINQWFWLELLIEARTLSVRAWLDGNSPGAYIVYTLAVLSGDLVLPTTLAVTAITSEIGTTTADWRVTLIELLCDTPDTGRQINDEFLGIGDGVRTTFTFQYPYQPRSPHVEVDNIHHLVTETDPTTGDIDLGFAPIAGETVTGSYRVA